MWDCRSVFLLEKAWSLIFCHIEPIQHREMTERVGCTSCVVEMALALEISRDDREGGMHIRRVVEDDVGILDS